MKITSSTHINRKIDIVISFPEMIECTEYIHNRNNLPSNKQYTDEQITWYNDLIESVLIALEDRDFNIIENYQSNESYSYYIKFEAFTYDGVSLGNFNIKFRISDHPEPSKKKRKNRDSNAGITRSQMDKGKDTIFRSILLNEVSKSGMYDTLKTIWSVLDELENGNIDALDKLKR